MERPNHDLQGIAAGSKQSRVVGLGIVIAIHVGIIAALILGLAQAQLRKEILAINASVEKQKVLPKAPPPPPPELVRPPPVSTVVPQFAIEAPPPPVVHTAPAAPAPVAKVAPTKLEPIARTHTLPPYPEVSQRLGEQGTTLIKVTIGLDGRVTDATVEKSSGSARLDQAAVDFVKSNWRWQPPTQEGKPIVASTLVSVVWNLKNAQ